MRAFDWHSHPLGDPASWPESLKTNIRLILNSRFPMFIWWTENLYMFHNDAYLPALGNKHPKALGASARVMWAEVWHEVGVIAENILRGGNPFYAEGLQLLLERNGFLEETYWTFSYSSAFDDRGEVNGIFCACFEMTSTMHGKRRLKTMKDVSERINQIRSIDQAGQLTCDILLQNKEDLPFSAIYLLNNTATEASLIGKAGNIEGDFLPVTISLMQEDTPWALKSTLNNRQMNLLDSSAMHIEAVLENRVPALIKQSVVLPVMRPGQDQVIGFFIAGLSPWLAYNSDYISFHELLAAHIATSVTSVQAREELARQQEYLSEIFQQAPVGIAIVRGPNYVIDLANPGVCEIWGRKSEEVLGKHVSEALPEVVDQGIIQLLDSVVEKGEPFITNEFPIVLERNGAMETVYLNFIYHPMRDSQGVTSGVIAVAVDISEQVKYKHSLEALNRELLVTNADLDNFVYSASHDLKAPISNIEGLMQALVDQLPEDVLDSETVQRLVELIQTSVDRFKRAVIDLTDVAKIQRQAGEDVASINLAEVVNEVQLDFEPEIKGVNARIETNIDPDIFIHFSSKNVRSIIYNLLSNALKYKAPDRQPFIEITAWHTNDHVVLSVADNGLGFEKAEESKIFSMFKRLHDHVEGTGVGLYIVKRIVENAGGAISVESEVGVGSTFKIYFKHSEKA